MFFTTFLSRAALTVHPRYLQGKRNSLGTGAVKMAPLVRSRDRNQPVRASVNLISGLDALPATVHDYQSKQD